MPHCEIVFQPDGHVVEADLGSTVASIAQSADIELHAPCGGEGRCGRCKIVVQDGGVSAPTEAELRALTAQELAQGFRLACQACVTGDATVDVPLSTSLRGKRILEEMSAREVALDPSVRCLAARVAPPSLEDQLDDHERLSRALGIPAEMLIVDLPILRELPEIVRSNEGHVAATLIGDRVVRLTPEDKAGRCYGAAIDLGTTTVVCYLVDLMTGERLATISALNPQADAGADVVSRVEVARDETDGLRRLQTAAVDAINELVSQAARLASVAVSDIFEATLVGNSCMHHLFWGLPPTHIAEAPYVTVTKRPTVALAREIGLRLNPEARLYFLPLIAGWVGADTAGVIGATRLTERAEPTIAIDLGTNGEVVLWTGQELLACSCAAGPAFEGGQIAQGMRAADGAVERVRWEQEQLRISTIGGQPAIGLCGSGLLDAVACLLDAGVVDETGRLVSAKDAGGLSPDMSARVMGEGDDHRVVLARPDESGVPEGVGLTQRDIRQVQLAKGAVRAGIEVLLGEAQLHVGDVGELLLAGAFGTYVDRRSAVRIGLVPEMPLERIQAVGNAAGAGALLALISQAEREYCEQVATATRHVELSGRLDFQMAFEEAMLFP